MLLLPKPLLLLNITSVPDKKKVDWRLTNALDRIRNGGSTQFTCFTGTKVQILTLRAADFGTPWSFEGLLESLRPENDLFLVGPDFGSYLEAQAT